MSSKTKADAKVTVLKGQDAEDKILEYLKRMNRPYGAVDVAANLKGAVPKATTQKILVALAERGHLVQKTYGKTTFFVVDQSKIDSIPPEKLAALETELKVIEEEQKGLVTNLKSHNSELLRLKLTPTELELAGQIAEAESTMASLLTRLQPLRSGAPLIAAEELAQVDMDWIKWRAEWVRRRKVFATFWQVSTDALSPQEAVSLAEDLGIEADTPEHIALESSPLCICPKSSNPLKRKR